MSSSAGDNRRTRLASLIGDGATLGEERPPDASTRLVLGPQPDQSELDYWRSRAMRAEIDLFVEEMESARERNAALKALAERTTPPTRGDAAQDPTAERSPS